MSSSEQREEEIFASAVQLPTEQRGAYLEQACGDDSALRLRIEALLRALERASPLLREPSATLFARTCPTISPTEKSGDKIGRYKLLEQIGEGGCGVVYVAEQEEPVRRRVALKVIKLGMDTKQVLARFDAERQALAMMDHPNIAKIHDAGVTETGRPYFVMELVRGIKITDYCDQNQVSPRERLDLFIQVCRAIQHAHQKGIIHRDIKPSNILVASNDGSPIPKVIDFGIAKAAQGRLTDQTVYTALEQFIGTPAYMSPEQASLSLQDVDTRSDIYSLGVLLYELLTGKTPFDAKELLAAGLDEMRRTIREKEPARPSTRLSTMVEGELSTTAKRRHTEAPKLIQLLRGDLDWIVMKCLEKDRTRRYETANGLGTDIARHLNNEPIVARPPSNLYRFQKSVQRNKLAFIAVATVFTALVAGLSLSTWQFIQKSRAEREQSRLRQEAQRAQANEAQLRRQAEAQELAARRRAYASDMNLVQQALARNNLGRAEQLLNRHGSQPGQQDLRGWEWRYLWAQCQSDASFTLCQRSNEICSLSRSADGKWLAVGEHEHGGLSIWNLETRQELPHPPAGDGYVFTAFSPRALVLAFSMVSGTLTSNRQESVRLWDGISQKTVAEFRLDGQCRGLAFSGDGQTLITSTFAETRSDNQIALWRVSDGKKLAGYPAEQDWISDVPQLAVAQDLRVAAHGTRAGDLRVVDLTTGKQRWKARATDEHIITLAFSPDDKILASSAGFAESVIRLWEVASGREIARLEGHRGYVQTLVFWPDGKTLASASSDQTIRLWNLTNLASVPPSRTLRGHKREVRRLTLLPDSTTLVSACQDGSVYVWDTAVSQRSRTYFTLPRAFKSYRRAWRFAPDSASILNVTPQGRLVQWRGTDFQEMVPLLELGTNIYGARISDDGRLVATGSEDGVIRMWDLPQGTLLHQFAASAGPVDPWQFLGRGQRLLIHDPRSNDAHEWDLTTGREIRSWRLGPVPGLWSAGFSQDGRWFFASTKDSPASLSDMRADPVQKRILDMIQVAQMALSPDGKLLAAASRFGYARLWETETLREVATFSNFLQGVNSVGFSADGKRLLTASEGKEAMKLWDVESNQELLTLEGQGSQPESPGFSPDGNILVSAYHSGMLQFWRAPSWAEIEAAEKTR